MSSNRITMNNHSNNKTKKTPKKTKQKKKKNLNLYQIKFIIQDYEVKIKKMKKLNEHNKVH